MIIFGFYLTSVIIAIIVMMIIIINTPRVYTLLIETY